MDTGQRPGFEHFECTWSARAHCYSITQAKFIWRKVVPGKKITLTANSSLARVFLRRKLTPLSEPRALAHALIVMPWPS